MMSALSSMSIFRSSLLTPGRSAFSTRASSRRCTSIWGDHNVGASRASRPPAPHELVIFGWIFFGYGLGLFGKVGATHALLLVVIVYALQGVISSWWLRHYRFGPV